MASPPIPPLQDHLANRPFSLYPPILNIRHNEWIFRKATWSEILVVNRSSGREIRIARRYVGEVSRIVGIRLERRNRRPLKLLVIALAALLALALAGIALKG